MKPKQKGAKNIFRLRNRTVPSALVNNQKLTQNRTSLCRSSKPTRKIVSGLRLTFIKRSGNSVTQEMELRHRERPHIFPSQLTSIYGWIGYQQLSPTIQHINLLIYPSLGYSYSRLVLQLITSINWTTILWHSKRLTQLPHYPLLGSMKCVPHIYCDSDQLTIPFSCVSSQHRVCPQLRFSISPALIKMSVTCIGQSLPIGYPLQWNSLNTSMTTWNCEYTWLKQSFALISQR